MTGHETILESSRRNLYLESDCLVEISLRVFNLKFGHDSLGNTKVSLGNTCQNTPFTNPRGGPASGRVPPRRDSRRRMPSAQTSLVDLILLLVLVSEASALFEKPKYDLRMFEEGSHRTDLCNVSRKYAPRQPPPPLGSKAACPGSILSPPGISRTGALPLQLAPPGTPEGGMPSPRGCSPLHLLTVARGGA